MMEYQNPSHGEVGDVVFVGNRRIGGDGDVVTEIHRRAVGEHERAIVSFFLVLVLVVGGGEIDAGKSLKGGEECRSDTCSQPAGHDGQHTLILILHGCDLAALVSLS
ncbi:hypothetical protein L6164_001091 [Bauhinia variegata]|uniref:Uncharacterized protein n=1 Tax=Bauhinia variegata TaxID=167791 RepID=A0ACB9Q8Q8_BAUVA|nr:hypothetical protein L6164_001091 [Bauhinia variegata]